jgi:beta-ureidopropionase
MRRVRVATVSFQYRGGPTVEANRVLIRNLLDQAVAEQPDIVVLPESFVSQGVDYTALEQIAEPIPGPTLDLVASYACAHHCYILCPLICDHETTARGRFQNNAVLIDRQGHIAGMYAKIHPVVQGSEFQNLELGITPGSEVPVFETDFGRIGVQICFDLMYPEAWAELKEKGAELVFWCSAYDGGKHLGIPAWLHKYYVVSAVQSRHSRVIGILGQTLAETGWHDPVLAYTLDLDIGLFHIDFNGSMIAALRKTYGPEITLDVWHEEGLFTLVTNRESLSLAEIVAEFNLDPLDAYLARNRALQDAIRVGEPVPDLTPPYVGRTQWV